MNYSVVHDCIDLYSASMFSLFDDRCRIRITVYGTHVLHRNGACASTAVVVSNLREVILMRSVGKLTQTDIHRYTGTELLHSASKWSRRKAVSGTRVQLTHDILGAHVTAKYETRLTKKAIQLAVRTRRSVDRLRTILMYICL